MELTKFPALKTLRIQRNPVVSELGPIVARQSVIARLPNIVRLNQSEVRSRERTDAEKGYLRAVSASIHQEQGVDLFAAISSAASSAGSGAGGAGAGSDRAVDGAAATAAVVAALSDEQRAQLESQHPRFLELLTTHGAEMVGGLSGGSTHQR